MRPADVFVQWQLEELLGHVDGRLNAHRYLKKQFGQWTAVFLGIINFLVTSKVPKSQSHCAISDGKPRPVLS